MKRAFALGTALMLALALMLAGCGGESEIPDVAGQKADDAKQALADAGFYSVELVQEDGTAAYVASLYTVVSQDPQAGTAADSTRKITLTVRDEAKADREATKEAEAEVKALMDGFVGSRATDAYADLTGRGYTVVMLHGVEDCTSAIAQGADDPDDPYTVTLAIGYDLDTNEARFYVGLRSELDRKAEVDEVRAALEEKLPSSNAWMAVQRTGKASYPEGFDVHEFFGRIAEQAQDENTWFLKAECDVTTEYGEEWKAICEATVTGTKDDPHVTSFVVYGQDDRWF